MSENMVINAPRILVLTEGDSPTGLRSWSQPIPEAQVFHTRDLLDAMTMVRNQGIDLVILNVATLEAVEMDLANVMREISPLPYLPVLVVLSDILVFRSYQGFSCGWDDILHTHGKLDDLRARIAMLLRIKDLSGQLASSHKALQNALTRERRLLQELRRDNEHLRELCTTDPLTHVQNIRSYKDLLFHEFKGAKRYNRHLSLLALDIDHFKVVNDAHGHPSGDYVLKELAVILTQSVRESDVVARTGGEEFSVLLPNADRDQAAQLAERIRTQVSARKFIVFGQSIHITVSVGSATYPSDAEITDADMLNYFADQALLVAKETGRDRVVSAHARGENWRARTRRRYLQACSNCRSPLLQSSD